MASLAIAAGMLALSSLAGPPPEEARAVHLRSGILRGPAAPESLSPSLVADPSEPLSGGPVVVRFDKPLAPDVRAAVERTGVRLAVPVGPDAFLAWIAPGALESARGAAGVAWIAPYHPGLRLAPEIAAVEADDPRAEIPMTVHVFAHADIRDVRARLERLGVVVRGESPGRLAEGVSGERPGRLVVTPSPADLVRIRETVARWPETLWIGVRPAYRLFNDAAVWIHESGLARGQATPVSDRGLLGEGQVVGVLDTGIDADACFFRDPVRGLPPTNFGFGTGSPDPAQRKVRIVNFLWSADNPPGTTRWDDQGHGTHVAGTVAGDNFATPGLRDPADGVAPRAQLVIQDGGYGVDNCADLPAIGCPAADLGPFFDQAYRQGARIHSNSWGDRENFTPYNIYSDGSEDADAFMWTRPDFLLVFAAGNNGGTSATVSSPATGKNVLAVGATSHDFGASAIASFSSRAPTADGRIKPDVTAQGVSVASARNDGNVGTNNCATALASGTSMACPTAAGLAALVREYFEKGFYPSGAPAPADALTPSAALLKAALIVSATPMEGVAAKPPSNEQGWGRVTLDEALYFAGDAKRLFAADVASRFASPADPADVHTLVVTDGSEPLRVVLAWTDYPSTPAAAINLVNDLDLTVEGPGGVVYRGNVLVNGLSTTGGAADRRNNVEVAWIPSPPAGTWTVRVSPFAVPQPSQGYALVATGRLLVPGVLLERASIQIDDSVGGDADGVLEPGEWADLPLTLRNIGLVTATGVVASAVSLSPHVEVVTTQTFFADIGGGGVAASGAPAIRIRAKTTLPCTQGIPLRFTYASSERTTVEDVTLPTGSKSIFLREDFEGLVSWLHVGAESTTSLGAWTLGDPVGTGWQPEDDATPPPGVRCFYTGPNPTGNPGVDDVDNGVVVARSGSYDLTGHPEARVQISRWFGNRDVGEDAGDYFRLHIRQGPGSPDVLLEELGSTVSAARWTEVTFRVADYVTPGPTVQLRAAASDGPALGNLIEAAIDEIVFWDPVCDPWNPAPNDPFPLRLDRAGADVVLRWPRPPADPAHGEADLYRVWRSESASGGFAVAQTLSDPATEVIWADAGAAAAAPVLYAYLVVAENPSGASAPVP